MKYTLFGFSQAKAIEYELDVNDLMILRWFVDYKDTGRMAKKIINEDIYYWIKYEAIIEDFPITNWKKDTVYRRFKKLVSKGILKHETIKQCGVWSYYSLGDNYIHLIDDGKKIKTEKDENGEYSKSNGKFSEVNGEDSRTNNPSTNNPSTNNNSFNECKNDNKSEKQKTNNKKENKSNKNNSYEEIINEFTDDELIKETIYDFIKMRTMIKKPLTDRALKGIIKKLKSLARDKKTQIQILEQSIMMNYVGVFPLKEDNQYSKRKKDEFTETLNEIQHELNGINNDLF